MDAFKPLIGLLCSLFLACPALADEYDPPIGATIRELDELRSEMPLDEEARPPERELCHARNLWWQSIAIARTEAGHDELVKMFREGYTGIDENRDETPFRLSFTGTFCWLPALREKLQNEQLTENELRDLPMVFYSDVGNTLLDRGEGNWFSRENRLTRIAEVERRWGLTDTGYVNYHIARLGPLDARWQRFLHTQANTPDDEHAVHRSFVRVDWGYGEVVWELVSARDSTTVVAGLAPYIIEPPGVILDNPEYMEGLLSIVRLQVPDAWIANDEGEVTPASFAAWWKRVQNPDVEDEAARRFWRPGEADVYTFIQGLQASEGIDYIAYANLLRRATDGDIDLPILPLGSYLPGISSEDPKPNTRHVRQLIEAEGKLIVRRWEFEQYVQSRERRAAFEAERKAEQEALESE